MSASDIETMLYPIGENERQTQRLITQAQLYNPFTRGFFRAAGITPGMQVLELGSGVGDVSLLLAELVGPSGRVVGVELAANAAETAHARVRAAGWRNVEFVTGDILAVDLPEDLDAAVGRFILMWLPDPLEVLRRVSGLLHSGGVLAFQDNDFSFSFTVTPALAIMDQLARLLNPIQEIPGGPDFHMGMRMPRLYREIGMPPPQLTFDAPVGTGANWTGYEYIAETVEMLVPRMKESGIQLDGVELANLADQLRREAVAKEAVIVLPAIIGAWSHKP